MVVEKRVPLTREGLQKLEAELEHLRTVRRQEVADRIHNAKEGTNAQNDAEYEDARNEQAFIEGRIVQLELMIKNHVLIDEDQRTSTGVARLGSVVVVESNGAKREYRIVGSAEADPATGRISNESPIGKALLGRRAGETVHVMAPKGTMKVTVVEVK